MLGLILVVAGCSGSQTTPDSGEACQDGCEGADAGEDAGADAGADVADEGPSPTITFTPQGPADPGIWLELEAADPENGTFTLKVVGKGIGNVYGVAGRLAFDRTHCSLEAARAGDALLGGTATLVAAGASTADGGVFGISRSGDFENAVDLDGSRVIGYLDFLLQDTGSFDLSFVDARSRAIDPGLRYIEVDGWLGGTLAHE
jgi:hypothetical protein